MPILALAYAAASGAVSPVLPIGFVVFGLVLFIFGFHIQTKLYLKHGPYQS